MKILYLNTDRGIPVLGDKGASVHVREFITALARQGHEVMLICANQGSGNPAPPARIIEIAPDDRQARLEAEVAKRSLPPDSLENAALRREIAKLVYDRRFRARAAASIKEAGFRPDFIYERHALFSSAGIELAEQLGVKRILEVNAPLVAEQKRFRGLHLESVAEAAEACSFQGADTVIAVSQEVRAHVISRGVPPEKVVVIRNGVDTGRFHPGIDGKPARRMLGLETEPVIGFIGSFKPWHGMDFLLDAFARIMARHADVHLLAVGDGPMLEPAKAQALRLGLGARASFPGRVPYHEIPACLAAMNFTVAPYMPQDDFYFSPLKIVESLAMGRPVVAPRIGQIESLIEHGQTGLLFRPGDLDECTACLASLIDHPERLRMMSDQASRKAMAEFSWSGVVRQVADLAAPSAPMARRA
jgi:glycosyltransferase involved in cell wall biosynthesis